MPIKQSGAIAQRLTQAYRHHLQDGGNCFFREIPDSNIFLAYTQGDGDITLTEKIVAANTGDHVVAKNAFIDLIKKHYPQFSENAEHIAQRIEDVYLQGLPCVLASQVMQSGDENV